MSQTKSTSCKKIEKLTQDFFKRLDFKNTDLKVNKLADDGFEINLKVRQEDSGILIGFHGETISSLQLILAHLVNAQTGQWQRLIVNVNDYRDRRNLSLSEMAKKAAQQVKDTGHSVALPPMGSFDRRLIHMNLSKDKEVETYSDGLGRNRHVIIAPTVKKDSVK